MILLNEAPKLVGQTGKRKGISIRYSPSVIHHDLLLQQ